VGHHGIAVVTKAYGPLRIGGLIVIAALMFFPFYAVLVGSITPPTKLLSAAATLPHEVSWDNYKRVLLASPYPGYFAHSLIVAVVTTATSLVLSTFGGYALARLDFPGRDVLSNAILLVYIMPSILLVVPLFTIITGLHLINTLMSVILAYLSFSLPFCLWMMRGFFASLSPSLEDAAQVDGATRVQAMLRVMFPLAAPGMVATAMFSFILAWNEYLFALIFLNSDVVRTIPIGVTATFVSEAMGLADWSALMAASVLSALPVFLLFMGLQRFLIQGIAAGAVKG